MCGRLCAVASDKRGKVLSPRRCRSGVWCQRSLTVLLCTTWIVIDLAGQQSRCLSSSSSRERESTLSRARSQLTVCPISTLTKTKYSLPPYRLPLNNAPQTQTLPPSPHNRPLAPAPRPHDHRPQTSYPATTDSRATHSCLNLDHGGRQQSAGSTGGRGRGTRRLLQ